MPRKKNQWRRPESQDDGYVADDSPVTPSAGSDKVSGSTGNGAPGLSSGPPFIVLPADHWLHEAAGKPPMGSRLGTDNAVYEERTKKLIAAGIYALRVATAHTSQGIDPDDLILNLVIGLHGYATPDGLPVADEEG